VRHFGRLLIGTQTALAFVLILGGALGLASLVRAWATDPGYDPSGLIVVDVSVRTADSAQVAPALARLNDAFEALPGVTSGMFSGRFLGGGWSVATVRTQPDGPVIEMQLVQAAGAFFDVINLTPLEGRLPTPAELSTGDEVVVVSKRAAQSLWPDGSAVGRHVFFSRGSATVIGIVNEPQFGGLLNGPVEAGQLYRTRGGRNETSFVLRTTGSTNAALEGAKRVVAAEGAAVDLIRAVTVNEALADTIKTRRLAAWLHGGFAFSALVIIATAVLGLVAMATSQRTREFGIRQALGARRDGLVAMLVREQLTTVAIGLIAGGIGAYWFQGLLRGAAAGVPATDYRLWIVTAATLIVTTLLGVLIPALKSTRVDPAQTLRSE
jgi:putative ABC transport system permease protein